MKALLIINEPFAEMALGKSSNLAYILSCLELGFETHLYNFSEENFFESKILVSFLDPKSAEVGKLIEKYKEINFELKENLKVADFLNDYAEKEVLVSDFDLIIQRLEPMKSPFPPAGSKNFNEALREIRKSFPNHIINLPNDLSDKETPQEIDRILAKKGESNISVPTVEFKIIDKEFPQIFTAAKMVFKPKNSAQSFGIFAVEKSEQGFDLETLKNIQISELINSQIYQVKNNLNIEEIREVIEILLAAQSVKTNKNLLKNYRNQNFNNISRSKIQQLALQLYNETILLQPFLEGVKSGDIRTLLLKDQKNNFYLAGHVFRRNLREISAQNFTTSYSTAGVTGSSILELSSAEQIDLNKNCQKLLKILNGELSEKYQDSLEVGVDFIPVGDGQNLLLGEINHTCPALMPIAESLAKESGKYDGGIFYIKKAISDVLARQRLD
jgi:hypothetical protein